MPGRPKTPLMSAVNGFIAMQIPAKPPTRLIAARVSPPSIPLTTSFKSHARGLEKTRQSM